MTSGTRALGALTVVALILLVLAFSEYILLFNGLILLLWADFVMQYRALQSLVLKREIQPQRLFVNEEFVLTLSWENHSNRVIEPLCMLSDRKAGLEVTEVSLKIKPHAKGKVFSKGTFFSYGKVDLGRTRLILKHPLGLYRIQRVFSFHEDVRVFPRLPELDFRREALKIPLPGRKTSSRLHEDSTILLKVRPYEREPWNRIHWKLSAKLDQWMVKEYAFSAAGAVHLLLDLNQPQAIHAKEVWSIFRNQYERYAIEASARLIWSLHAQGIPLALTCMGKDTYHRSLAKRDPVEDLEDLIGLQGCANPTVDAMDYFLRNSSELRPGDTVVIFTMHLDQEKLASLIELRSRCSKVMALLFPYGYRSETTEATDDHLSAHPLAKELLQIASDLSAHHIHVRFLSQQQTLQEGIHAFS